MFWWFRHIGLATDAIPDGHFALPGITLWFFAAQSGAQ
jgi:hypothetical protein